MPIHVVLALQLWVNLIMDSLASLSLATEAPTDATLDLPPYSPSKALLAPSVRVLTASLPFKRCCSMPAVAYMLLYRS